MECSHDLEVMSSNPDQVELGGALYFCSKSSLNQKYNVVHEVMSFLKPGMRRIKQHKFNSHCLSHVPVKSGFVCLPLVRQMSS